LLFAGGEMCFFHPTSFRREKQPFFAKKRKKQRGYLGGQTGRFLGKLHKKRRCGAVFGDDEILLLILPNECRRKIGKIP